jgi:glutamate-1-semialdehyde 2,1-aminomutase
MSERTLDVLRRRRDMACVLVNPLQAMHLNAAAPGDSQLIDSAGRRAQFDREAYAEWLHRLAEVCRAAGIVLIFDEVFTGFRLAPGGAAEYFGVAPDLVTYGKTLGGGLPVGVICGRAPLMRRWRDDRPVDICFARGTFNAHPYVMGAMDAFLRRLEQPETQALYDGLDARFEARRRLLNERLAAADLPVRVEGMQSIWTVLYTRPSRYNWMLQYYLRANGLALSWVGTGRLIFSFDMDDTLFAEVADRFVTAAQTMAADGWWWTGAGVTDKALRRGVLRETVRARLGRR